MSPPGSTRGPKASSSRRWTRSTRRAADKIGDAARDIADGVGDAARDIGNGVKRAVR